MYKLSDIVGKSVVSLYEARRAGTLIGALFDKNLSRIKFFELFTEDESDIERKYFSPDCVGDLDYDAVTIRNGGKLTGRYSISPAFVQAPINAEAYSPRGVLLGRVSDVLLEGFMVVGIVIGNREFAPTAVLSRSEDIVIINDTDQKIRLTPPVRRIPKPESAADSVVRVTSAKAYPEPVREPQPPENAFERQSAQGAAITAAAALPEQTVVVASASASAMPVAAADDAQYSSPEMPMRVPKEMVTVTKAPSISESKTFGYAFLLGRLVTKTLLRDDGSILIEEGKRVDNEVLANANSAAKLVQLALHSQ